jgi:uracil-DNA glycosylase
MDFKDLAQRVYACRECTRLRQYCQKISLQKKKIYQDQTYWELPIMGFGDHDARLVIVGLAPSAHGALRTGRPFTGDASGEWLYQVLFEMGFGNQPQKSFLYAQEGIINDGLFLKDAYITCAVRCAPPENKVNSQEKANCLPFLQQELLMLKKKKVILALGKLAFEQICKVFDVPAKGFAHGHQLALSHSVILCSYHPSPQNTHTGKLSWFMWRQIFSQAKALLG